MIFRREPSSPPCLADAPTTTCRPLSILLSQEVYIADRTNGTTATAATNDGCTVEISFWIADPPAVSYFSVHCPGSKSTAEELDEEPHVVGAEGRFVLFRALFASGPGEYDYFMYRAGDGVSAASLELVPPPDDRDGLFGVSEFGIVPRGNGGHYLVAALRDAKVSLDYEIRVYSSEDERWSTKLLLNPLPGFDFKSLWIEKVITLGEGVLGWVDFRQGMLVCNLLQEPPTARYIPLPEPLPETRKKLESSQGRADLAHIRDLTCTNGVIRFIEMEHRIVVREIDPEKPSDPSLKDVLYDSDLITWRKRKYVDRETKKVKSMNGWRVVMWTRVIDSNCWFKECAVDVDDILVDDSTYSVLLSDQNDESLGNLTFRNMYSAWPTLGMGGDDLYLTSSLNFSGQNGRVVAIDLAEKTLKVKALGAHSQTYRSCTLSSHLNMNPGHC
ncbi:unnamed protein product [Urochloa decumbens]|uniref:DUF1618 domain-containing protein n=1 Tax=Urochloa decumbens TaxID=240449 RepID=A0ABC8XQS4_9POAL